MALLTVGTVQVLTEKRNDSYPNPIAGLLNNYIILFKYFTIAHRCGSC